MTDTSVVEESVCCVCLDVFDKNLQKCTLNCCVAKYHGECLVKLVCHSSDISKIRCCVCQKHVSKSQTKKILNMCVFKHINFQKVQNGEAYEASFEIDVKFKYKITIPLIIKMAIMVHNLNILLFHCLIKGETCTLCCRNLVFSKLIVMAPTNFKYWCLYECIHCKEKFCVRDMYKLCMTNLDYNNWIFKEIA